MRVFRNFSEITKQLNAVITIGTFDGIHVGHLDILSRMKEIANERNLESMVITFEPHPRYVLAKNFNIKLLTVLSEKIAVIEENGIDNLLIIPFNKELASLTAKEFIDKLKDSNINIEHIVIGYDHRFGKDRSGDENEVRKLGEINSFTVTKVEAVKINGDEISSTKIRKALLNGDIEFANKYLGKKYYFKGKVVEGNKRGRLLGFPTANIRPFENEKLIPKKGVYFVKCYLKDETYFSVTNIGVRPTFEEVDGFMSADKFRIEAHLFNFNRDIYGQEIKVEFLERLRDEIKFESPDLLIKQIENDFEKGLKLSEKYGKNN